MLTGTAGASSSAAERRRAAGSGRRWETIAVIVASLLTAIVMTWPTPAHPASTITSDLGDPLYQTWAMAWLAHAMLHQPLHAFDGNAFWPLHHSAAFSDISPGMAFLGVGVGDPADALVRYNLAYVLAAAVNLAGAYALARQLGSGRTGAAVAGAAFAFTPWRLAHAAHLNILFTGGVPLSLALLLRGHGLGPGGRRLDRARPAAAMAGWAVAAWQAGMGFAVGLPFAYVLLVITSACVIAWVVKGRPAPPRRLLVADAAGGLVFGGAVIAMGAVLLRVAHDFPEATVGRGDAALRAFSPPLGGLWMAHQNSAVWRWTTSGLRIPGLDLDEMALFPGALVTVLAALGIFVSVWTTRRRVLLMTVVATSVVLALGTTVLGGHWTWVPARAALPGVAAIRTSGRLIMWAMLALGLLAAGAITRFQRSSRHVLARLALWAVPGLVALEGLSGVPHPRVPGPPAVFRAARPPVLVLPSSVLSDTQVMFWSIGRFPAVGNGSSSFEPAAELALRTATTHFPDPWSVAVLRARGFRTVVVPRVLVNERTWTDLATRTLDGLPVHREQGGDGLIFTLD